MAVGSKLATYSDRKEARDKVVHVKNVYLRFALEKQMLYCPSVSTCTLSTSITSASSCCTPCSCDENSAPLEQCPDYRGKDTRLACLHPQYSNSQDKTKRSRESYLMINRCPTDYKDPSIEQLCVRGQTIHPYNISMVLPVTDVTNKVTYRNIFCAECNSRSERDLVAWSSYLNCSSQSVPDPETIRDLLETVAHNNQCNVLFEPSNHMTLTKCNTSRTISECNVTGQWNVFDDVLDRACTSYRSVYRSIYQNIHCYICNVNSEPYKTCERTDALSTNSVPNLSISTFSAAIEPILISDLRFQHDSESICPIGTRYDGIKKSCREIYCSPPLVYRNGQCSSIYHFVSLRRYSVTLLITPHFNVSYKWITSPWAAGKLGGYSTTYLSDILSPLQVVECSSGVENYVKTIHEAADVFPRQNESRVIYIKVPMEFVIDGMYNDISVMDMIVNSDVRTYNTTIIDQDIFFDFSLLTRDKLAAIISEPVFINGEELKGGVRLPSFSSESMFGACHSRIPAVKLSSFTLCSKVNISNDDYNTTIVNDNSFCLFDLDLCFSQEEFEYNDKYSLLCSERFFERIDKLSSNVAKNSTSDQAVQIHVGLVLVCLSIVCLGVTLLYVFCIYKPRTLTSYMLLGLVVCLTLYNIVLLSVPFPFVSAYSCRMTGASLQFTSILSVSLLQLCVLNIALRMRTDRHFQNPYILKITYVSYPVIMSSTIASVTYWYTVSQSPDVTVPWIPWRLPCYSAVNSLSLYISSFPALILLALTFLVCLVLAIYSYAMSFENDDVEFVHIFGVYCKISFIMLLVHSFWYLISFANWTGNVYLFLAMNLISSLYIMLCSFTDSKLKATYTSTAETRKKRETHDTRDLKRTSGCPCNPVRRQPKDFRPISEAVSESQNEQQGRSSCHL
ncbi:uncharacterized protein LOC132559871 [Ylistrum balloti]|uniref:uncharacterized protein LOC132559871 n=1 Tax=Ylistrum balloti TaxID=509963 RepID=UPI0029057FD3|nr:uncharacterized protein LOC132559871 [Ylistrum balloti]